MNNIIQQNYYHSSLATTHRRSQRTRSPPSKQMKQTSSSFSSFRGGGGGRVWDTVLLACAPLGGRPRFRFAGAASSTAPATTVGAVTPISSHWWWSTLIRSRPSTELSCCWSCCFCWFSMNTSNDSKIGIEFVFTDQAVKGETLI